MPVASAWRNSDQAARRAMLFAVVVNLSVEKWLQRAVQQSNRLAGRAEFKPARIGRAGSFCAIPGSGDRRQRARPALDHLPGDFGILKRGRPFDKIGPGQKLHLHFVERAGGIEQIVDLTVHSRFQPGQNLLAGQGADRRMDRRFARFSSAGGMKQPPVCGKFCKGRAWEWSSAFDIEQNCCHRPRPDRCPGLQNSNLFCPRQVQRQGRGVVKKSVVASRFAAVIAEIQNINVAQMPVTNLFALAEKDQTVGAGV